MSSSVVDYMNYDNIYLHANSYMCSSIHVVFGDHVRQWLDIMCIVLGLSLLLLLDYMSRYWLRWGCYDSIKDDLKMLGVFLGASRMICIVR